MSAKTKSARARRLDVRNPIQAEDRTTVLESLRIAGLHGYINKTILLNKDVTILVGINGSGKTSVLNVINWLLSPALPRLCTTEFTELTLRLKFQGKPCVLRCTQTRKQLKYHVEFAKKEFKPLVVALVMPPAEMSKGMADFSEIYTNLAPTKEEQETWRFLQSLPKASVIGLDRSMRGREGAERPDGRVLPARTPLAEIKHLANSNYNKYSNQVIDLNNKFKDKFMLSAFDIASAQLANSAVKPIDFTKVDEWQHRVERYLTKSSQSKHVNNEELKRAATDYFTSVKALMPRTGSSQEPALLVQAAQFQRIQALLEGLEEFEKESAKAHQKIKQYLDAVNGLLKDTCKSVMFTVDTNELSFNVLNREGGVVGGVRDIEKLSSGEQQAMILLTYLAFTDGGIFIIDEPELSLHPRWQEQLLGVFLSIMPSGTQLLIATHSPAVVGRYANLCRTLLPFNEDQNDNR